MSRIKLAAAIAAASLLSMTTGAAAQTKLSYGTYLPANHSINVAGIQPLATRLASESGGKITLEILSGGVAAKATGAVDSIRDRLVSAGKITDILVSRQLPYSSLITQLALLGKDPLVMGPATNEFNMLRCPECQEEQKREGILSMAYYSTTPHILICKQPLRSLEALKGKRVSAVGPYALMYESFGMVPVNLPHEEGYEAFQRGQIDCADAVDAWMRTLSLWEPAKNVLNIDIGTYHGGLAFAINADLWRSMPADQRAIVKRNMPMLVGDVLFAYLDDAKSVREEARTSKGVNFLVPDESIAKALADYRTVELNRVREQARKSGLKNADQLIDTYLGLMEKWEKLNQDEIKGDKAKLVEVLEREIYAKTTW